MAFIKYPLTAISSDLSHTDQIIFLKLLFFHFRFCHSDYDIPLHFTDRDLASVSLCSTSSIWKAKKNLSAAGLIKFEIGRKNRTYYTIISPNGKPHK
jgi:hypothetical protein